MMCLSKLEEEIRNEFKPLTQIANIDELSELCSKIENKILSLIICKTQKYGKLLFNKIHMCGFDYLVDTSGNKYLITIADDILDNSSMSICINKNFSKTKATDLTNLDFTINTTGRYHNIHLIIHKDLIPSNTKIVDFYKMIFETSYSCFKETVIQYVSNSKVCVAKNIYSYVKSLFTNRDLLKNFWFAIVGQGYGFRLVDLDLTENAFQIINDSIDDYASYTNKLVSELLGTKLPTEKMLMTLAIKHKQTLIGELNKALYTSEGSIYSTTLYALYGSESFVMWPIYIDEFSVLALYPTEVKTEIEETIQPHLNYLRRRIAEEIDVLIKAYDLFNGYKTDDSSTYTVKLSVIIKKILNMLFQAHMSDLPYDVGINITKIFKSHVDYDDNIFFDALNSLKNNCYISECADKTYRISEKGIKYLKEKETMSNKQSNASNVFNGPVTISGDFISNYYNSVDLEEFSKIIKQLTECANKEELYLREVILEKINELDSEVHKKNPNKNMIYNILDWLSKISSTAGFCITLNNLLAPIISNC